MDNKIKILIVDDEPDFVEIIKINLKKENYSLYVARSGEEAVKKVFSINPDLVILDFNLPGICGDEVCKIIRSNYKTREIGVLMLTVRSLDKDFVNGFSCGVDDYMIKPFDVSEMLARIKNILARMGKAPR